MTAPTRPAIPLLLGDWTDGPYAAEVSYDPDSGYFFVCEVPLDGAREVLGEPEVFYTQVPMRHPEHVQGAVFRAYGVRLPMGELRGLMDEGARL